MKKEEFEKKYWNYYLMLENRVIELEPFIAFDKSNYQTYSLKIMDLLISVCCEVESLCKLISKKSGNINSYLDFLNNDQFYSSVKNDLVFFKKIDTLKPFKCNSNDQLEWWNSHNGLKHNRINEFQTATLKNLINALAGLYLLEIYYYNKNYFKKGDTTVPEVESKLFKSNKIKSNIASLTSIVCEEF